MKIRFAEHITNQPVVEITTDSCKFDTIDAVVTVSFFEWEDGSLVYKPAVRANIYTGGKFAPEDAYDWGICLISSYTISKFSNWDIEKKHIAELDKAFARVNECLKKLEPA